MAMANPHGSRPSHLGRLVMGEGTSCLCPRLPSYARSDAPVVATLIGSYIVLVFAWLMVPIAVSGSFHDIAYLFWPGSLWVIGAIWARYAFRSARPGRRRQAALASLVLNVLSLIVFTGYWSARYVEMMKYQANHSRYSQDLPSGCPWPFPGPLAPV